MKNYLALFISAIFLASCEKEDLKLPGRFTSNFIGKADLVSGGGADYQMQLYYDLSSNRLKAQNNRDAWDLAFACGKGQPNIIVNAAMLQSVAATGSHDFNKTFDPEDYTFQYERADRYFTRGVMSRDFESTASPAGEVFLVDLGRTLQNQPRGHIMCQILNYSDSAYTLKVALLDHSNLQEIQVETDDRYNFVFLSLGSPDEVLYFEPPKDEWDLLFTKYMERLPEGTDTLDYSVTGCLINPWYTEAYLDSTQSYDSTTLADLAPTQLSSTQNNIGHDWKYYDLQTGVYSVDGRKVYFIKDSEGIYYKLHFAGFYDDAGRKGAITFEYLPL